MTLSFRLNQGLVFFPFLMLGILIAVLYAGWGSGSTFLQAAVADVLLTIPLIYFLIIRKRAVPNITVIPLSLAGLFLVSFFVPQKDMLWFTLVKSAWTGLAEVVVIAFIVTKFVGIRNAYGKQSDHRHSFPRMMRMAVNEVIPGLAGKLFSGEMLAIFFSVRGWGRTSADSNSFTSYRQSQVLVLYSVILFLLTAETIIFHILLAQWSSIAAWILTGISIYSFIQLMGFMGALRHVPTRLADGWLELNYGIYASALTRPENIRSAQVITSGNDDEEAFRMTMLGTLEPVNLTLDFHQPVAVERLYGKTVYTDRLQIFIDDPDRFLSDLDKTALK